MQAFNRNAPQLLSYIFYLLQFIFSTSAHGQEATETSRAAQRNCLEICSEAECRVSSVEWVRRSRRLSRSAAGA